MGAQLGSVWNKYTLILKFQLKGIERQKPQAIGRNPLYTDDWLVLDSHRL